jgi:tripartite-type tricarboxylate transporter receptor subunit TctC
MKRYLVVLLVFLITATAFGNGGAQSSNSASGYPNRPIELLVPSAPGAASNTYGRTIAPYLEKYLGVPVVIVSKPGAGGLEMIVTAKNSRPDGYTWASWTVAAVLLPCIIGNLKGTVNPLTDFRDAGATVIDYITMITRKGLGYKTIDEIVNASKANPGTLIFGRSAPGSSDDSFVRYLQQQKGAMFNIVDGYPSFGAALLGGHVDVMFDSMATTLQAYQDGGIDIIGVGSDQPLPELPGVVTFKELGYNFAFEAQHRYVFGHAGIPDEIAAIFNEALRKAANDPEYLERLRTMGVRPYYTDSEATAKLKQETAVAFERLFN